MFGPDAIFFEAEKTGRLWLGGELECEFGLTCDEVYQKFYKIGCDCGHIVTKMGNSRVKVSMAFEDGYQILDWYDGDRPGPWTIANFNPYAAYRVVTRDKDGKVKIEKQRGQKI